MSATTALTSRVDRSAGMVWLFVGDAVAMVAFAAIGVFHHGGDPLGDPGRVAWAVAPLLLGWVLPAVLGGLYTWNAITSVRRALAWALPAWLVATLVGNALRATEPVPGGTALSFVLVTFGIGGAFVLGWRGAAALFVDRT
jgi:hypothetical protein